MSKYIYCNGKIYNNENNNLHILSLQDLVGDFDTENEYRLVEYHYHNPCCKTILEHMNSYIDFDSFEDLIEVGDMIIRDNHRLDDYNENDIQNPIITKRWFNENKSKLKLWLRGDVEIWKRVDNTFIRVGHKEEGNWVIDNVQDNN